MTDKNADWKSSGVSETIGFVIILGIVMTGIGIVTLYGYPALLQEQSNSNIKNMEKNLLVLQSDIISLTFKSVPYQETTMQVSGGTLIIKKDPDPSVPIFFINISGGPTISHNPGELKFISQDGMVNIALENGAVHIRYWSDATGSAMLAEPPWYYDSTTGTYVVHLIRLNASSDFAQSGIGTVRMQLNEGSPQKEYDIASHDTTITYTADPAEDYRVAWKNYFNQPDLRMTSVSENWPSVTYRLDPSATKLVVKTSNITILSL